MGSWRQSSGLVVVACLVFLHFSFAAPQGLAMLNMWRARSRPRVEAMVFYGRRATVQMLDCYLRSNLEKNGGVLQQVTWFVKTTNPDDLQFLEKLLAAEPEHYRKVVQPDKGWGEWSQYYKGLKDDTWYFKIDDDIVYIGQGALENMLHMARAHSKKCLIWSANVVNHSLLTYLHITNGATMLFERQRRSKVWVSRPGEHVSKSPAIAQAAYDAKNKCTWESWECAALEHYSLLEHIHKQQLHTYYFPVHDFHALGYRRWSINFILFRGRDFNKGKVYGDDEETISNIIPRERNKHACVAGHALAAHFAYFPQRGPLTDNADVLERYRGLAESKCGQLVPTNPQ